MLFNEKVSAYLERNPDAISKDFPKGHILGVLKSPTNDSELFIKEISPDHQKVIATLVSDSKKQIAKVEINVAEVEKAHEQLKTKDGIGYPEIEFVNKSLRQLLRCRHINLLKILHHPYLKDEPKKKKVDISTENAGNAFTQAVAA